MGPAGRGVHLRPAAVPGAAVSSLRERRADCAWIERARRLEQRARRRSLERNLSQRPHRPPGAAAAPRASAPATRSPPRTSRRPTPRSPRPASARAGVYIGSDLHGGSFVYDPWLLYARGVLSIANTLVLGMPDFGKSSLTKSWLYRSRVFGRRCEIIDPKGEYSAARARPRRRRPAPAARRARRG